MPTSFFRWWLERTVKSYAQKNALEIWKFDTGKSLLEALFLASTNPQYDKRLVIDLPVQ